MAFELPGKKADRALVLCFRLGDLERVGAGSRVEACTRCQAGIWLHEATHARVNETFSDEEMDLLCPDCALRQMALHPGQYALELTEEQEEASELRPLLLVLREMQRRDRRATGRL